MAEMISRYISVTEATRSDIAKKLGISNMPNQWELENLKLAAELFDKLRGYHRKPIYVSSFFRSKELNEATPGSSKTSAHMAGAITGRRESAIDIDCDFFNNGITNKEAFEVLREFGGFDELIWEFGNNENPDWVHFSVRESGNRGKVLRSKRVKGKVIYEEF